MLQSSLNVCFLLSKLQAQYGNTAIHGTHFFKPSDYGKPSSFNAEDDAISLASYLDSLEKAYTYFINKHARLEQHSSGNGNKITALKFDYHIFDSTSATVVSQAYARLLDLVSSLSYIYLIVTDHLIDATKLGVSVLYEYFH